jgi:hypothetical protein
MIVEVERTGDHSDYSEFLNNLVLTFAVWMGIIRIIWQGQTFAVRMALIHYDACGRRTSS